MIVASKYGHCPAQLSAAGASMFISPLWLAEVLLLNVRYQVHVLTAMNRYDGGKVIIKQQLLCSVRPPSSPSSSPSFLSPPVVILDIPILLAEHQGSSTMSDKQEQFSPHGRDDVAT